MRDGDSLAWLVFLGLVQKGRMVRFGSHIVAPVVHDGCYIVLESIGDDKHSLATEN